MSKVTIITVELGENIDTIISDDITELTSKNLEVVNQAIEQKQETMKVRQQKVEKIDQEARAKVAALATVYQALLAAHSKDDAVDLDEMIKLSSPAITNASSLVLQLKSFIRKEHDNEYVLQRKKRNKKPVYELIKFNAE